jgi:hypothetical protein
MVWDVEVTGEFREWYGSLDDAAADAVGVAVDVLAETGPTLGRPLVDRIKGSAHHNMKELRVSAGGRRLRVLFAFDPRATAILLLGGDKTGHWAGWYAAAIPAADELYETYLGELRDEGVLP